MATSKIILRGTKTSKQDNSWAKEEIHTRILLWWYACINKPQQTMPTIMALMKYRKRGMQGWGIVFECVTVGGSGWADVKLQAHFSFSKGLFRWGSEDGMKNMQIQYTNSVQMQYKWTVDTNISWIQLFGGDIVRSWWKHTHSCAVNKLYSVVSNQVTKGQGHLLSYEYRYQYRYICVWLTFV